MRARARASTFCLRANSDRSFASAARIFATRSGGTSKMCASVLTSSPRNCRIWEGVHSDFFSETEKPSRERRALTKSTSASTPPFSADQRKSSR